MQIKLSEQTKAFILARYHLKQVDALLFPFEDSTEHEELFNKLEKPLMELRKWSDELILDSIHTHLDNTDFSGVI